MLNWLRFLCLLLAGLALFTGWVWQERSKWVYAIDWHLTKFYEGDTAERIKELRKQMYGGELEFPVGIEELKEIQSENRHAVFGDRKFAFWRASTEVLSEALMETERYEEVIQALSEVREKDPTHIPLHFRLASALCLAGGAQNLRKAQEIVDAWKYKIPTHPDLQAAQGLILADQKDAEGLARTLAESLYLTVPNLTKGWQVFLFPQGEGAVAKSPLLNLTGPEEDGRYALEFQFPQVPESLFQMRLDAPIFTRLRLSDWSLEMEMDGIPTENTERWNWTSFVAVEELPDGSYAIRSDKDPRMRMRFPSALPAKAPLDVRLRFRVDPILSLPMRERLADPSFRTQVAAELERLQWPHRLDDVCPLPPAQEDGQ